MYTMHPTVHPTGHNLNIYIALKRTPFSLGHLQRRDVSDRLRPP
jgi:hypothetical protein